MPSSVVYKRLFVERVVAYEDRAGFEPIAFVTCERPCPLQGCRVPLEIRSCKEDYTVVDSVPNESELGAFLRIPPASWVLVVRKPFVHDVPWDVFGAIPAVTLEKNIGDGALEIVLRAIKAASVPCRASARRSVFSINLRQSHAGDYPQHPSGSEREARSAPVSKACL